METLPLASCTSDSNWLFQEINGTNWTTEENKMFERALAIFDQDTPDRWVNVAAMIPGKTAFDVMMQYKVLEDDVSEIEAGLVDDDSFDALRKKSSAARPSDHERKKGVPWTEDEHRRFLMGLLKHGKGDWRNISRNFVVSKTPTQVASHAQKYFIRQSSGGKDKRRPSIHDITTVNLTDTTENNKPLPSDETTVPPPQQKSTGVPKVLLDWNHQNNEAVMVFDSAPGNLFMPSVYEVAARGLKLQGQNLYNGIHHGPGIGFHNSAFQVQSKRQQIRG
ncbi:hypothetical protein L1049_011903 [Liquidambar formosana]|uniref:Uncharacterized protein n=1 Tax=Liquidambar formosana TaxID=63359 RepID=A0AAP0WY58_LIQFO